MNALLLAVLLLGPLSPPFAARWQSPTVARLAWAQPPNVALTCLYRAPRDQLPILIRCWQNAPAGPALTWLGAVGPLDAAYRPAAHDAYVLDFDGVAQRAQLRSVVALPVVRR